MYSLLVQAMTLQQWTRSGVQWSLVLSWWECAVEVQASMSVGGHSSILP